LNLRYGMLGESRLKDKGRPNHDNKQSTTIRVEGTIK